MSTEPHSRQVFKRDHVSYVLRHVWNFRFSDLVKPYGQSLLPSLPCSHDAKPHQSVVAYDNFVVENCPSCHSLLDADAVEKSLCCRGPNRAAVVNMGFNEGVIESHSLLDAETWLGSVQLSYPKRHISCYFLDLLLLAEMMVNRYSQIPRAVRP